MSLESYLNTTVQVYRKSAGATNAEGARTETYALNGTVKANLRELSGSEVFEAQQRNMISTHRLVTLNTEDIILTDRIVYDSKSYDVINIDNKETVELQSFSGFYQIDLRYVGVKQ